MAASQPANFNLQEFTDAGQLLVGGRLYTYAYGTTAQKVAYTDPAGTVPHTYTADGAGGQYIALNARGELPAPLYLGAGSYDLTLKRADGSTVWTRKADGVENSINSWIAALAASAGASLIGFIQGGVGAIVRTILDKLRERPSIDDYGAVDGQDSTTALQRAFDANNTVWVPPGKNYFINTVAMSSNQRLILDGKLTRIANAISDSYMITNASGAAGDSNIIIEGKGELDGNAAGQTGDRQGLIKFQKPTDCLVRIRKAGNNRYDNSNLTTTGQGCIVFTDATRSHIEVRFLNLWQREGIYIDGASTKCSIRNVTAVGDGLNSWSAVSISGAGAAYNKIDNIDADNCGASSVGCDSTYSQVNKIISRNNQFQNGVNFGHTGKPATGTRATNITVLNAGQGATSGTHCGIQVGGGTTDMDMANVTIVGSYTHCIQVSDGATRFQLGGKNRLSGALHGCGFNSFGASQVRVSGTTATGNSDYGVNFNAGDDCSVDDSDLRGNALGGLSYTGSRVTCRNTPCSSVDGLTGSVNLVASGALAAGASVVVNNANVNGFATLINPFPRDAAAAGGLPYISSKGTGTFTITVVNAVSATGAPHNVSFDIA